MVIRDWDVVKSVWFEDCGCNRRADNVS
jgi:hypothetical protein